MPGDFRNWLAKARDEWMLSDEGSRCADGTAAGQYLRNRLEMAFIAGANVGAARIATLEAAAGDLVSIYPILTFTDDWQMVLNRSEAELVAARSLFAALRAGKEGN